MYEDEDSVTAKEARQQREAARAEWLSGRDRIHRHDALAGAKARQRAQTIGTDWEEDEEDHRRKTKEEVFREKQAVRSATDRLDHLHKQLVAMEIGATQTRAVLRRWLGADAEDDGGYREEPNGLFESLERAVHGLRITLEDIQVLIGDD